MSKFSIKYKLRKGDTYENLVQRFGPNVLADAGIYGDEDLVNNKEFTLTTSTREEAELLQKKDSEYQKNIQKQKDLAYIKANEDWLKRENFFQGGEQLTEEQMLEKFRTIYKLGKQEHQDRKAYKQELDKKLEEGKITAQNNQQARQNGIYNEHTARFTPPNALS